MQSENNIFISAGDPIARFVKTVDHVITGWRLDPDNKEVAFILSTPTDVFDYDTAVLEFYSERDLKTFKLRNKYLIEQGLIKEFKGINEEPDATNLLTDAEIDGIAATRTPQMMAQKLAELTSILTVQRVLKAAEELGRPTKTLQTIRDRIQELTV